jgi:hypothetical protein
VDGRVKPGHDEGRDWIASEQVLPCANALRLTQGDDVRGNAESYRSNRASRLDVSQRLPPIFSTSE